ncbi:MAG TPA: response regulator [Candidatus Acidoferrales bacterium]|jgi:signal transduction histidine kinase|nr:response regulator [Candidatus Acidoferrales bacterium]
MELAPTEKVVEPKPVLEPVNVLLVDDESRNLAALESILEPMPGLQLVRALRAEEALLALLSQEFACIVLDIQMPDMSGLELARQIKTRKRNQHVPIIFLTAFYLDEKDIIMGYGAGAVDYLTKPINPEILKSKVGAFVDLFRANRALAAANRALEIEVNQRKKAEEALRQANNELEKRVQERTAELKRAHSELLTASHAKDDFLATLSHELRTPLNPILLLASDAMNNRDLPPRIRTDFNTIRKNVEMEARLIDDLLDLTRIARGKIILEKNSVNLGSALQDAIAQVREEMSQKQIVLDLRLKAARHTVFADAVRLQQIFWNLLKNAVKFTPHGGQIIIETSSGEDKIFVKISDTGIGMTPEELSAIFTAFSQGEHAAANGHRFGGLGLGLSISQKLTELHSGKITASSLGRDKGSAFTVELPLASAADTVGDPATPKPPENVPSGGSAKSLRILLVEDHEPTRTTLAGLLARRRYEVSAAATVAEARALAGTRSFDLLITDIGLPDGNGYDLMNELGKKNNLRGIALTGYGMEHDVARSENAGFDAHLTKPVRIQSLEAALDLTARNIEA